MDWGQLLAEVERVLVALENAQAQVSADIADGLKRGDQLRDAARTLGESSSGSWAGWHSRMYYGNYEEPSIDESWNSEWGGLQGFSNRWQQRSQAEVQRAIEDRAGVSLADVARIADRVRQACQPLQEEVMTVLSPVCDLAGLGKEAELLGKLEKVDWIVSPGNFIRAITPTVMSRDSQAVSQGIQAPLHLNVEAAIVTNTSTLATSRDFLTDAIRLARQVRTKLKAMPDSSRAEAASLGNTVNGRLHRRLWRRSLALFVLLALGVVAGELWLLRTFGHSHLAAAVIAIAGALAIGGVYAWLLDRAHVRWAFLGGAGILGAIAALDQILGHFLP